MEVLKDKIPSMKRDVIILHTGQQILQMKIQVYVSLHQMALVLGIGQAAVVLEQCFKMSRGRIFTCRKSHIIYPDIAAQAE